MKKRIAGLLLASLMIISLAGCRRTPPAETDAARTEDTEESTEESGTQTGPEVPDEDPPERRTLLSAGGVTVSGSVREALTGGFTGGAFSRSDSDEDSASGAFSFRLEKEVGGGYLSITGQVFAGADASPLFDFDVDAEEDPAAGKSANDYLKEYAAECLSADDPEARLAETEVLPGYIAWTYGTALIHAPEEGLEIANLYAFAFEEPGVFWVQAGAVLKGGEDPEAVMAEVKAGLEEWLFSLSAELPAEEGGRMAVPLGEKTFAAAVPDLFAAPGASFSFTSDGGELTLDAAGGKTAGVVLSLRTAGELDKEMSAAFADFSGEAAEGGLAWQTASSEGEDGTVLLARTEDGTFFVRADVSAWDEEEREEMNALLEEVNAWLASAGVR